MRFLREEIIPLSSRENLILLLIISSIFQFTLFFTPLLANEAVKQAKAASNDDLIIAISPVIKSELPDETLAGVTNSEPVSESVAATSTDVTAARPTSSTPAATSSDKVIRTSTHVITAYNSEPGQTDNSPCITANGFDVCEHGQEDTIAANFLKFGTKVKIPELFGDRIFVVRDRMNKKHPNRVDIWMLDKKAALKFGVKTAKIVVIE